MLSPVEGRVVGALIEKERTVPDQYPLSMQGLLSACNQATAREPVMALTADDATAAITSLKAQGLARVVHPTHGRGVTKYRQVLDESLQLERPETALLAVLLLRGPQTASELRQRSERLHAFDDQGQAEEALRALEQRGLARLLERQVGQSAQRWQQLVAEEPEPTAAPRAVVSPSGERIAALEATVAALAARVEALEAVLAELMG